MILQIGVLVLLILINAFFAASEIALISVNDNRIRILAQSGNRKAEILNRLTEEPSGFLATIQIGITLAGFLASAFAADSFSAVIVEKALAWGVPVPQNVLATLSVIIITLILSYFTLVFGELVPKRLAMKKAEPIAMFAARPLLLLSRLAAPFVKLLTGSTNVLVRLFGVDPNSDDEEASEEEIRMLVDAGLEQGNIQRSEQTIIHRIFDFDNKTAADMMTPWMDTVALQADAGLAEVTALVEREQYTRIPVYEGRTDYIIGILHVKDLIGCLSGTCGEGWDLREHLREPYYVTEWRKGDELLEEMQQNRVHMAIVVDEYGGVAGLISTEDLLEEIVGGLYDEYDQEEQEYEKIADYHYLFKGTQRLDDIRNMLLVDLPDTHDTLSGFVIGMLGRIPVKGEKPEFEYGGYRFKAEEIGRQRINKVRMQKLE